MVDSALANQLTFEQLRPEHLDQVVAIEQTAYPTPWSKNSFLYEISNNILAHYLAAVTTDGQVIGYAGIWLILDEAHLTNVAVHKDFRRRGLGLELVQRMIVWAMALGATRMTLEVRPSNTPARTLYTALGFEERGIRKNYYSDTGENAIIMWKDHLP
ncbi:MAG: ribosomal protein S18-alanine N-acetyltransferase [Firmicutes bacterium]|nr:ribosomal protein S18-alanine N-acetyltransferase [Bacillota bacterium]